MGLSGPDTFCVTYKRSSGFKAKAGEVPHSPPGMRGPQSRTAGQRKERPGREPLLPVSVQSVELVSRHEPTRLQGCELQTTASLLRG